MSLLDTFKIIFSNNNIVGLLSSTFFLLLIGIFFGKKNIFDEKVADNLSNIVLNLSIAALSILAFMNDFNPAIFQEGKNILIWSILLHILFIAITKYFYLNREHDKQVAMEVSTLFGAVTTLGIPIVQALFDSTGLIYMSIFTIVYRLLLYSYGFFKMSNTKVSKANLKLIFLNPAIFCTLLGLIIWLTQNSTYQVLVDNRSYGIFRIDKTAFWLYKPLVYLASLCSPLSWLAAGIKLSKLPFLKSLKCLEAWYFSFIKIVIFPIITVVLITFLGGLGFFPLSTVGLTVIAIAFGTPLASVTIAYAIKYNRSAVLCSKCFFVSTLFSLIFLPFLLSFVEMLNN
ncbi:MAG: AEC family transporter [Fusobacteriaceae bacterium]|nr:AEC family transporter [Fusobacteriaceae bacterium]